MLALRDSGLGPRDFGSGPRDFGPGPRDFGLGLRDFGLGPRDFALSYVCFTFGSSYCNKICFERNQEVYSCIKNGFLL